MDVYRKTGTYAYNQLTMSKEEYAEYAYEWRDLVGAYDRIVIYPDKKPTNPPSVTYIRERLVTAPVHTEDGWYVSPLKYLKGDVLSVRQHRSMIGFVAMPSS